ncbi:MAG: PilN domain-containing protein, partial [Candidatus Riflebacteria bacterium]|nr:PilN domain-containing protein [Candidatus Riflebacteria bacterium]
GVSSKFGGSFTEKLFKLDEQKLRIIAGLLAALLLLLGAYPVVKIRQKISAIKSDYKMLQKKLEQLNVSQASVKSLLEDQKILEKYGSFAREIKKLHFNNSAMLLEIASLTPDAIFLTAAEFSTDTPNATFKLLGHADNSDSVFEYLGTLGRSSILQNPTLESTQEVPIDTDRYFIRFVLNGRINSEALRRHTDVTEETKPEPEDDFEPIID